MTLSKSWWRLLPLAALLAAGGGALSLEAQEAPRSILPPGFGSPTPTPTPAPTPRQTAPAAVPAAPLPPGTAPAADPPGAIVQPLPGTARQPSPPPRRAERVDPDVLADLPTLEELETLSTDELDERLGLKPRFDIPEAARRSLTRTGFLRAVDGGLPSESLARQDGELVAAILAALDGPVVSRWGHIVLRRALVSRLAVPRGLDPAQFVALRARALNAMGEYAAARALVQSIDTADWNAGVSAAALDAFLGTGDLLGACPATNIAGAAGESVEWQMLASICDAYAGEASRAQSDLNRVRRENGVEAIDVLLAQRYAGAAGEGRRAVTIEWDGVERLTPWRYALSHALGEEVPVGLQASAPSGYRASVPFIPNLAPERRLEAARAAAEAGVFSAAAMVDLYAQIMLSEETASDAFSGARQLRTAYVHPDPAARLAAIEAVWGGQDPSYAALVTTAYAAARLRPRGELADSDWKLIGSMLTAGLDRNAMRWEGAVEEGSIAFGLLALADPDGGTVSRGELDSFVDRDGEGRKSRFLLAGLAGLDRLSGGVADDFAERLNVDLAPRTRWARTIRAAGEADNPTLVILLAALGMQGGGWDMMTPRHLFAIVDALHSVGLTAEARMIAAEAVVRA
jgi:hypothetical protein